MHACAPHVLQKEKSTHSRACEIYVITPRACRGEKMRNNESATRVRRVSAILSPRARVGTRARAAGSWPRDSRGRERRWLTRDARESRCTAARAIKHTRARINANDLAVETPARCSPSSLFLPPTFISFYLLVPHLSLSLARSLFLLLLLPRTFCSRLPSSFCSLSPTNFVFSLLSYESERGGSRWVSFLIARPSLFAGGQTQRAAPKSSGGVDTYLLFRSLSIPLALSAEFSFGSEPQRV